MRQVFVQVPAGHGEEVLGIAESYNATNSASLTGHARDSDVDVVLLHVRNADVGRLLDDLASFDASVSFLAETALTLGPPVQEIDEGVIDVASRSPAEVLLSALSSIGSWPAYLGYAALAGVVVWIGLATDREFLLVGAMLLAPFGAPAIMSAVATARGDVRLLADSVWRYTLGIVVMIATCALLSAAVGLEIATRLMIETAEVSATAVLLPLAAGAAGALHLAQSQRASLVSGAAVGLLVAAALAPAAGVTGMGLVLGLWGMVGNGLFLLVLQLVGINLTGALLFRVFGLSAAGIRFARGRRRIFPTGLTVTVIALVGLLTVQFIVAPGLQRASEAQRAVGAIEDVLDAHAHGELLDADVRFTEQGPAGRQTLLGTVYIAAEGGPEQPEVVRADLEDHLREAGFSPTPLLDVRLLSPPRTGAAEGASP